LRIKNPKINSNPVVNATGFFFASKLSSEVSKGKSGGKTSEVSKSNPNRKPLKD
jgi:hypothetical protein